MGYAHIFYGLDLERLKGLFGSRQEAFARQVLKKQAEDVENNDAFFEDEIQDGTCPDTKTALDEILAGKLTQPRQASMYGYTLKIICEHIGKQFDEEVCAVREHPYESQLALSGPPLPIPYDARNFPQIGYLALADIPAEISRIDSAPRHVKPPLIIFPNDESLVRDMENYRTTLQKALKKRLDIVSFRH